MKIIVVGDGKVGFAIAKQLNQEGHDITVVENKANVLSSTMNQLDIVGVQGNGASLDTLLEARVPSSDLLIAATSTDEVNIICCLLAKKLGARLPLLVFVIQNTITQFV
jgi:trk system potassium uptake protein TrkA